MGSISIRSSPSLLRAKWRFIAAGPSFLSSVFVRIFMQMNSFLFVSLPTTFLNLLTLQSQISLKTHLPASLPPSPCPAAPSAPSAACSRPRPHCAFRLVKSTGSTSVTGSREAPFSLKRLSLRLRLSSLPCFLPFLQSLSSPLPAHACPVSVRIHPCSAAGSPVLILCPFSGRQMHVCNLLFPALPRVSDLYIQLSRHIHVELSKSLLKPPV